MRFLPNGDPVAVFSVADSQEKDKPTIWWRCQLFGTRAESLSQYLTKGQAVTVTGNITQRTYSDNNGVEKVSTEIRVNDVALQGGKRDQQEQAPRQAAPRPAPTRQVPPRQAAPRPSSGFDEMDDDIPFN